MHATSFDPQALERRDIVNALVMALARYPLLQRLLDLARWWTPAVRWGGMTIVLRHDDVRRVLGDAEAFPVPWGKKMEWITGPSAGGASPGCPVGAGRNFVLGMPDRQAPYDSDYELLARAFHEDDVQKKVGGLALAATENQLHCNQSTIDIIEHLITAVPTLLCGSYFGLTLPADTTTFAKCTLAASSFVFGPEFDELQAARPSRKLRLAQAAAPHIQCVIRRSIQTARQAVAADNAPDTPLVRLVRGTADDDDVHSMLFGMVLGFIPTNVLAGGNILETLLDQPAFMAKVLEAVDADDDVLLWRCLRETLRFRNINFGPLRICKKDTELQAEGGTWRIREGDRVLASTQSAMFDQRRVQHPHEFDSGRPEQDYMVFGTGLHWCLGAYIAQAQLTAMFKVLFSRYKVERVPGRKGRMKRFQVFPLHLHVKLSDREP